MPESFDIETLRARVRARAERLPADVWDCEACGTEGAMEVRSSHLNRDVMADDISMKCMECWHVRTHGVPFTSVDAFETERVGRPGTIVDFAEDAADDATRRDQLEALGYLAAAESH